MSTATYRKSLGGAPLSDAEKATLTPDQLYRLALGMKIKLRQVDRDRLHGDRLYRLSLGKKIVLTTKDRSRLSSEQLHRLILAGILNSD